MPTATRWEPDEQLIAAILAGSTRTMADLVAADRCWVVAGLTRHRLTAEEIADRLSCSLRLVRAIRAEDMTQVCLRLQEETSHFTDELRLVRSEHRAALIALDRARAERDRARAALARVAAGEPTVDTCHAGHELTGYNVYRAHGRRYCRECHRTRQANYRARRAVVLTDVSHVEASGP